MRTRFFLSLFLAYIVFSAVAQTSDLRIEYKPVISGSIDRRVLKALEDGSRTFQTVKQPPATISILRKMAEADVDTLEKILKTEGYYSPSVSLEIDTGAKPVSVKFVVEHGPLYVLTSVKISDESGAAAGPLFLQELGFVEEIQAHADEILRIEKHLLKWFMEQGYPFPVIVDRKITVDHSKRNVSASWIVRRGDEAKFGDIVIRSAISMDEKIILRKVPWKKGDVFDDRKLAKFQKRLSGMGLFNMVRISTGDALDSDGTLPIVIELEERKPRTIGLGAGYRTDEGLGAGVSWEHRNLRHKAERFTISGKASKVAITGEAEYAKPEFIHPDQYLIIGARRAKEEPDAYTSDNFTTTAMLRRELTQRMSIGGGLGYKHARVEQNDNVNIYDLFFLPVTFDYDTTDDLFVPTKGGRLSTWVAPYRDADFNDPGFIKAHVTGTRYLMVSSSPDIVVAGRISLGTIAGTAIEKVPIDERFYSGGGSSIRGYAYKSVSPMDGETPIGGTSFFEASFETRIGLTERIGIIPFVDAGNAYEDSIPDFNNLLFGAGIGLSYKTPIGPLRLDIAFPLDKREGIDDSMQFYISLGSPF